MTKEEALDYLKRIKENYHWCCEEDALEMAIKALEKLPSVNPKEPKTDEDCISRQATLKPYDGLKDDDVIAVWLIRKNIEQQKTVNPQEPICEEREKGECPYYAG